MQLVTDARWLGQQLRIRWLAPALVPVVTLSTPPAVAQDSVAAPDTTLGAIEGVATDSLHGGPLVGAQVALDGSTRFTVTDSTGAFSFDSLAPGTYRVALYHPVLDSLGLGVASPPLGVRAGHPVETALAVPSASTIEGLACHGPPILPDSGGGLSAVLGQVLDAESQAPIVAARVALTWMDITFSRDEGLKHIQRERDVVTGPGGTFRFCWVPTTLSGTLHAARTYEGEVIERPVTMADRRVALVTVHAPDPLVHDRAPLGAMLTGRVVRTDGAPVVGARVRVPGGGDSAVTDVAGAFTLRRLPTGTRSAVVRAVGYDQETVPVELALGTPAHVVVPLAPKTVVLATVMVEARLKAGYNRVGFDRRQAMGFGRFLTESDIRRRDALEFHDLLTGVPGVRVVTSRSGEPYLTGTRDNPCINYIVDGRLFAQLNPDDIDTFVRPRDIGGIEVYEPGDLPGELVVGPMTQCTTIVIWTKTVLGIL